MEWVELTFAKTSGIFTGDSPVSYWPIFSPIPRSIPRSLCDSQLGPVPFSLLKRRIELRELGVPHEVDKLEFEATTRSDAILCFITSFKGLQRNIT